MTAPGPYAYTRQQCEACEDTGIDLVFETECTECDMPTANQIRESVRSAYRNRFADYADRLDPERDTFSKACAAYWKKPHRPWYKRFLP